MKNIYVRRSGVKTSSTRQAYLTSMIKQEHLLAFSELDLKEEFKDINKELVIELPNELMNQHSLDDELFWNTVNQTYIDKFKNITDYDNVAAAIHLNSSGTNLHMHLSYIDRTLDNAPKIAKRDSHIYVSTGTKLKKSDYNESNPNHLKINKGDILLDYDKVSNEQKLEWKAFMLGDNPNKAKFDLRREIKDTLQDTSNSYSNCLEGGVDPRLLKSSLNEYKELFKELNNQFLEECGYKSKYVVNEMTELGFLPYKKVGKVIDGQPNDIQRKVIEYNETAGKFNNLVQYSILENDNLTQEQKLDLIEAIEVRNDKKVTWSIMGQKNNFEFLIIHVTHLYNWLKEKIETILSLPELERRKKFEELENKLKEYEEPVIEEEYEEPVIEEPANELEDEKPQTNKEKYKQWLEDLSKDEPANELEDEKPQRRGPTLRL